MKRQYCLVHFFVVTMMYGAADDDRPEHAQPAVSSSYAVARSIDDTKQAFHWCKRLYPHPDDAAAPTYVSSPFVQVRNGYTMRLPDGTLDERHDVPTTVILGWFYGARAHRAIVDAARNVCDSDLSLLRADPMRYRERDTGELQKITPFILHRLKLHHLLITQFANDPAFINALERSILKGVFIRADLKSADGSLLMRSFKYTQDEKVAQYTPSQKGDKKKVANAICAFFDQKQQLPSSGEMLMSDNSEFNSRAEVILSSLQKTDDLKGNNLEQRYADWVRAFNCPMSYAFYINTKQISQILAPMRALLRAYNEHIHQERLLQLQHPQESDSETAFDEEVDTQLLDGFEQEKKKCDVL